MKNGFFSIYFWEPRCDVTAAARCRLTEDIMALKLKRASYWEFAPFMLPHDVSVLQTTRGQHTTRLIIVTWCFRF